MHAVDETASIKQQMEAIGKAAKSVSQQLAAASVETKVKALHAAADALVSRKSEVLAQNAKDMNAGREKGLDAAMLDRLELNEARIDGIANGLRAVADLSDPVGKVLSEWDQPSGLEIKRVAVPLGVIGIIYESRPNVTADAGALCLKSGNAAILRGGSESFYSSAIIVECLHQGLEAAGLPKEAIQLVPTTDRAAVGHMLTLAEYIDIIVPRGGKGLCARVQEESRIPTLQHLDGNCHSYIHSSADAQKAVNVVINAKLRRTGICGATESLVIDHAVAGSILPKLIDALEAKGGCALVGDDAAVAADSRITPATDDDWGTEYLAAKLSVKCVDGVDEAIAWVNRYSSGHTDAIICEDQAAKEAYLARVDSAIVMHNTSTQFADGGEFGMGAEIGISTGRLHARGPVGVDQLTTYKYVVSSDGITRS